MPCYMRRGSVAALRALRFKRTCLLISAIRVWLAIARAEVTVFSDLNHLSLRISSGFERTSGGKGIRSVRKYFFAGFVVFAVVLIAVFVWPGHLLRGGSSAPAAEAGIYAPGQAVPAVAAATAQKLVSGTTAEQRAALSPSLAASLPQGTLFPAGSALTLDSDSWHQAGGYANATGTLSEPGVSAHSVEIGFMSSNGTWLVTFEESLS